MAGKQATAVVDAEGEQLARLAGVARAWSPDGTTLALTRPRGLVLARPGRPGGPRVVFSRGSGTLSWIAFTPDSRSVVFAGGLGAAQMAEVAGGPVRPFPGQPFGTWSSTGRYATATPAGATVRVAVGDRLGRGERVVARLPYDDTGSSSLAWLGDGSAVLYGGSAGARGDLWTMRADGSGQRRLTGTLPVSQPAWNAAGTQIAYAAPRPAGEGRIVVADPRGRTLALLGGVQPRDGSPSWSPDGSAVAVANAEAGGAFAIAVASGRRTPVAVDGVAPAWSPDGLTIAFVDLDDGTAWGARPNGADRHRLLPAGVRGITAIAWSPDGKRLAYSTATGIHLAAVDGSSAPHRVVAATAPGRPSFSPDGRSLAYAAATGGLHPHREVWVVNADGSSPKRLTTGSYDSTDPAWRP